LRVVIQFDTHKFVLITIISFLRLPFSRQIPAAAFLFLVVLVKTASAIAE